MSPFTFTFQGVTDNKLAGASSISGARIYVNGNPLYPLNTQSVLEKVVSLLPETDVEFV